MDTRNHTYNLLLEEFDKGCELCSQYDSLPHQYGDEILYQSEMHFLQAIGNNPNITITYIAQQLGKTKSACSQMVRKLSAKNLLFQERNKNNNREYYLHLTDYGLALYEAHEDFDRKCIQRTYDNLNDFSEEELQTYINVQKKLNEVFEKDIHEHTAL